MRTKTLITVLGAAALLAATGVPAAAQDAEVPDLQARVDDFVGLLPGGAAAITVRDGVTTTAAAGIADADGTPLGVDTPVLIGGTATLPLYVLVLQLVEDGLVDLDEPITTYLPDAPVAEDATIRDLLIFRAGVPLPPDAGVEVVRADPERIFTADDLVRSMDREEIRPLGDVADGFGSTLLVAQLIEAATDTDAGTVLAEQVTGPLGMTATRRSDGDPEALGDVAGGWAALGDEPIYLPNTSNASRTLRPTVTSAEDMATYLSALVAGEVISPEFLESTVFDEGMEFLAYGLFRPDGPFVEDLNLIDSSDRRWFGMFTDSHTGATNAVAVDPDTGDVLVVITNNEDLYATALALDIAADWDADASTTDVAASPAQGTLQYTPLILCDNGEVNGFYMAPCAVDDEGNHVVYNGLAQLSGTLDGAASISGNLTFRPDGTFVADTKVIFVGEVEGCGTGTVYFLAADAEGFSTGDGTPNWTQNTWDVVIGGTVPVSGSFEALGPETLVTFPTTEIDYAGELTCADAAG